MLDISEKGEKICSMFLLVSWRFHKTDSHKKGPFVWPSLPGTSLKLHVRWTFKIRLKVKSTYRLRLYFEYQVAV